MSAVSEFISLFEGRHLGNEHNLFSLRLSQVSKGDRFCDGRGRTWILKSIDGNRYTWSCKGTDMVGEGEPSDMVGDSLPKKTPRSADPKTAPRRPRSPLKTI